MLVETEVEVLTKLLISVHVSIANLDILVFPTSQFVSLATRKEASASDVENGRREQTASYQIDSIVVAEVHGGPPDPSGVNGKSNSELRETVAHEKSLENSVGRVQRRECAEWYWCVGEVGGVEINAEKLVDAGQSGG